MAVWHLPCMPSDVAHLMHQLLLMHEMCIAGQVTQKAMFSQSSPEVVKCLAITGRFFF